jgi:P4 family phage/plasmid primase-like protien
VQNGVIDLRTGEFREFRQENYLLEKIDVVYDPNARCPVFCGFMETVTNQAVDRLTLIDWLACHAIKLPLPYVMFLLGLGRNGKGLYERLMKAFYGHAAFRDFAIDAPAKNNFAASKLFRKRGWIAAETNTTEKETVIGTELFKLISGNGAIDGDVKYSIEGLHFEPYTQITCDTNGMPRFKDKSVGWEERIVTMNLPYLFKERLEKDNPLVKIADPDLYDKLTSPSELSGILNLIIDRAKLICKTKRITKRSGSAMLKGYGEQSNSVTTFLNTFCEYESSLSGKLTEFAPVYDAFETWCQRTVSEKVDSGYFGKLLKKYCGGMEPKIEKKTVGKKRVQVKHYRGLIFDEATYKATIEKLQAGFKVENVYSVHTEGTDESTEKNDSLLSVSIVSIENQWKVIIEKYSVVLIGGFMPQKGMDTISTIDTDNRQPQNLSTGDFLLYPKPENPMDTSGNQPGVSKLVGSSPQEEPGKCKDASIPDETALGSNYAQTMPISEHDRFTRNVYERATKEQRRTCHVCLRVADYDFMPDSSDRKYVNKYICADCNRSGAKPQVEAPINTVKIDASQTTLGEVVPTT